MLEAAYNITNTILSYNKRLQKSPSGGKSATTTKNLLKSATKKTKESQSRNKDPALL